MVRGTNNEAPYYAIFSSCVLFVLRPKHISLYYRSFPTYEHSFVRPWYSRLAPQLVDAMLISASWCSVCPLCFCFRQLSAMLLYTAVYLDIWRVVHLTGLLSGQLTLLYKALPTYKWRWLTTWASEQNPVWSRRASDYTGVDYTGVDCI
jgi:hypothetical protein